MLPPDLDTPGSAPDPFADSPAGASGGFIPLARPLIVPIAQPVGFSNPMLLAGISAGQAALHLLILLGCFVILIAITSLIIFSAADGDVPEDASPAAVRAMMIGTLIGGAGLAGAALIIMRMAKLPVSSLGLSTSSWWVDALLGVPVAILSYVAFLVSYGAMWLLWPEGCRQLQENAGRIEDMLPADVSVLTLVLMMVAVATYEEIIFRGFVMVHLRRITRNWPVALVLSAGLFALLHIGENVGSQTTATAIPLFLVAVVWSAAALWRRSLLPAVVGHALFNSSQLLALKYLSDTGGS